jgi:hypothetical protein
MTELEWEPLRPDAAQELLARLDVPWFVAGGWALDLFLGDERPHGDLDIALLRRDASELPSALPDWELRLALDGRVEPWAGEGVAAGSIWARPCDAGRWWLEFVLEDVDGDTWSYRRDARVTRPLAELAWGRDGLRVVAPEVVLLFKSRLSGVHDADDFARTLPSLDERARAWLASALATSHPDHPWLAEL